MMLPRAGKKNKRTCAIWPCHVFRNASKSSLSTICVPHKWWLNGGRCVCFTSWVFLNFTSPTDRVQLGPQAGSWETTALLGTIRWRNPRSFLFLSAISIPHINMATLQIQKPCHDLGFLSHWPCNAHLIGLWQAKWWHEHPSNAQIPSQHLSHNAQVPSFWNLQSNLSRKPAPD